MKIVNTGLNILIFLSFVGLFACGSSNSTDSSGSNPSLVVSATVPTSSLSAPPTSLTRAAVVGAPLPLAAIVDEGVAYAETVASNVTCTGHTLAEVPLETETRNPTTGAITEGPVTCTTDASGECTLDLTTAQFNAGVLVECDNPSDTVAPIHSVYVPDSGDLAAAQAGTPPTVEASTDSDIGYAATKAACGGSMGACPATVDLDCMFEATAAIIEEDETPSTSDFDGTIGAIFVAHQQAILNGAEAATTPGDALVSAFRGEPTSFTGLAGTEVSGVSVTTAITQGNELFSKIKDSYCNKTDASSDSTWDTIKSEAGDDFDPVGPVGFFKEFIPDELANYEAEDFRGFARVLPDVPGGMATMRYHDEAREAMMRQFRLGTFANPAHAGAASGFIFAAFPPPPVEGDWRNRTWTGFDPETAAYAADNGFREMGEDFRGRFTPGQIYNEWKDTLSNRENQTSFARGREAWESAMDDFENNGTDFDARNFTFKKPPGGSCTSDDDCLPCDNCVNQICNSGSRKMGSLCDDESDCDEITTCRGMFFSSTNVNIKGNCMCASDQPPGAHIFMAGGSGPVAVGGGAWAPPADGGEGAPCGPGLTACTGTLSCAPFNICVPGTFKRPPRTPCDQDSQCEADGGCVNNLCAEFSANEQAEFGGSQEGFGVLAVGDHCTDGWQCNTNFCNFANGAVCSAPPQNFTNPGDFACNNNGTCDAQIGETNNSCPHDCGQGGAPICGNRICNAGESPQSCPADCFGGAGACGNGTCDAPHETVEFCPVDCGLAEFEAICNDAVDNDEDGNTDCADDDCAGIGNCGGNNPCNACMQPCMGNGGNPPGCFIMCVNIGACEPMD